MNRNTRHLALFALLSLLVLAGGAAQAQPVEVALGTSPQMLLSDSCMVAQEQCSTNCVGLEGRAEVVSCLMGCDNAAALCSRDEQPTLDSEWYTEQFGNLLTTKAGACHSTTPCSAEYSSCGTWSGYSNCGDPYCGVYRFCGGPCPDYPYCFGEATRQYQERYRVCFNQQGQSCTEYQRINTLVGCGC